MPSMNIAHTNSIATARHDAYALASVLLKQQKSKIEIESELIRKGFDPDLANQIAIEMMAEKRKNAIKRAKQDRKLGSVLLIMGLFLLQIPYFFSWDCILLAAITALVGLFVCINSLMYERTSIERIDWMLSQKLPPSS